MKTFNKLVNNLRQVSFEGYVTENENVFSKDLKYILYLFLFRTTIGVLQSILLQTPGT